MPSSTFSFKSVDRPLRGILLAIATILVLESALHFLPSAMMTNMVERRTEVRTSPQRDILVMGDSVAAGILPSRLMEKVSLSHDWSVGNQSHYATGPEFAYFFLKAMVDAGKAPKVIWYAPSPHTLRSTRWPLFYGAYATPTEAMQVAWQTGTYSELVMGLASQASWTLRYRGALASAIRGRPELLWSILFDRPLTTALEEANGDNNNRFTLETLPYEFLDHPFSVEPQVDFYIREFCKLAQDNGIVLVWSSMPVLPAVAELRQTYGFEEAYCAYLADLSQSYGVVSRFEHFTVYPVDRFLDVSHLTSNGRIEFETALSERWSEDPAFLTALAAPQR